MTIIVITILIVAPLSGSQRVEAERESQSNEKKIDFFWIGCSRDFTVTKLHVRTH